MRLPGLLAGGAASAFLLALGLPNEAFHYGFPVLGALALIPLYIFLPMASSWRATFLAAGVYGGLAHGFSSYWLFFFHDFAFWTLGTTVIAYFLFYGVYGLYLGFILKKAGRLRPLAFALAWVALEYVKSTGFLGYPWGLLAYTQTAFLPMLQIADTTGVYGVSFVLAFLNAGLAEALLSWAATGGKMGRERLPGWSSWQSNRFAPAALGLALLLLGANLGYGAWRLAQPLAKIGSLSAILVQQDLDPWAAGEEEGLRRNLDLAREEMARTGARPDMVVFSESSLSRPYKDFPAWFASHPRGGPLSSFIKESGAWLFTGAPIVLDWEKEEMTNSVILIDPEGRQAGDYAKVHPVPFAEAIPFWDLAPFRHFIQDVVGLESGWVMGREYRVFHLATSTGVWSFGAPICFEDAFPGLCREFFLQDVDFLVNLTNDAWSRTDSAELQHFAAARFRAIEARRTLVRSTNGGLSCVVDVQGRIVAALPLFTATARLVEIPIFRSEGRTAYVSYGDWFALSAVVLCACLFLALALGPSLRNFRLGLRRPRRP